MTAAVLLQGAWAAPTFTDIGIPDGARAGEPIPVYVKLSSDADIDKVWLYYRNPAEDLYTERSMDWNGTSGAWTHEIPAQTWKGVVEWRLTVEYGDESLQYPPNDDYGEIEILGKSPPKPFPWNIVLMVAFLGVVLILTELAFKPGVYRKTGRERAMELEEEDRLRELEEEGDGESVHQE